MWNFIKKTIIISCLLTFYAYFLVIETTPNNIILFQGEELETKELLGFCFKEKEKTMNASASINGEQKVKNIGVETLSLSLFNTIPIKDVTVSVLPKTTVIPVGTIAGVKLYTSGVLVVGMSEIEGKDNKKYKPYENTGIEEGDTIVKIDEKHITSTDDLINKVNQSKGNEIKVEYIHEQETKQCSLMPVQTNNDEYKLGLWVRDSAAGVGTVTFYEPSTKTFGALGHGITDIDTEELINISSGEIVTTKILNITKGQSGTPGKIQGTIDSQKNIGIINKNSKFGIYGTVENISNLNINASKEMEVAYRDEIKLGKAYIIGSLDGQQVKEYEIEITKIYKENNYDNKSMLIKVTDEELIEKTGGIIQRNVRFSDNTKWKIYWGSNTCFSQ